MTDKEKLEEIKALIEDSGIMPQGAYHTLEKIKRVLYDEDQ